MLHLHTQQRLLLALGRPVFTLAPVEAAGNVSQQYCVASMCSSRLQTSCSLRRSSSPCYCSLSSAVVGTFASTAGETPLWLLLIAIGHICWLGTCSAHSLQLQPLPRYFNGCLELTYSPCLPDCPPGLHHRTSCCLSFRICWTGVYCCASRRGWRSAPVACRSGSWLGWVGYWLRGS